MWFKLLIQINMPMAKSFGFSDNRNVDNNNSRGDNCSFGDDCNDSIV